MSEEEVPQGHTANDGHKEVPIVDHYREHQGIAEHVVEQEDGGLGEEGTEPTGQRPQHSRGCFQGKKGGTLAWWARSGLLTFASGTCAHLGTVNLGVEEDFLER